MSEIINVSASTANTSSLLVGRVALLICIKSEMHDALMKVKLKKRSERKVETSYRSNTCKIVIQARAVI